MKIDVRVEATANEKRRFLGGADVTPMVELMSDMLDDLMTMVVAARRAALEEQGFGVEPLDDRPDDKQAADLRQVLR